MEDHSCSWTGIRVVTTSLLPKVVFRCDTILVKMPVTFFTELEKKS